MRLPLAVLNDNRDSSRDKDSLGVNCFVEKEDELRSVKRPGLIQTIDATDPEAVGQGIFIDPSDPTDPKVVSLIDDLLLIYELDPEIGGTWDWEISVDSGWDIGAVSPPSGVAATPPYPVSFPTNYVP